MQYAQLQQTNGVASGVHRRTEPTVCANSGDATGRPEIVLTRRVRRTAGKEQQSHQHRAHGSRDIKRRSRNIHSTINGR